MPVKPAPLAHDGVRSLAVALTALAGDPHRARIAVARLMTEQGLADGPAIEASVRADVDGRPPRASWPLEELLARFLAEGMTHADWRSASLAHPDLFPRTAEAAWYDHVTASYGADPPWHSLPACLGYVALLCDEFVGSVTVDATSGAIAVDGAAEAPRAPRSCDHGAGDPGT